MQAVLQLETWLSLALLTRETIVVMTQWEVRFMLRLLAEIV